MSLSNIRTWVVVFLLGIVWIPSVASALMMRNSCEFNRSLRLGMSGNDVFLLQKALNARVETQIAATGAGSPGNESVYFGRLTQKAVAKYQDLHRDDILVPANMKSGNGFFGSLTRAVLIRDCAVPVRQIPSNTLPTVMPPPVVVPPIATTSVVTLEMPKVELNLLGTSTFADRLAPQIFFPTSFTLLPGNTVSLIGQGFTAQENSVHIGSIMVSGVSSMDSHMLIVLLPNNVPLGKQDIFVSNSQGQSRPVSVVIRANAGVLVPKISTVSPESGPVGTSITITGEGFLSENTVHYAGKAVSVSSSDGKTLSFVVDPGVNIHEQQPRAFQLPVWVYVTNVNGFSDAKKIMISIIQ